MKINNKGFTLIELMVTVVIVGILGAVAVPAYQDYTIRSQVTEGLSILSGIKTNISERHAIDGVLFKNYDKLNDMDFISQYNNTTNFVSSVRFEVNQHRISAVFGDKAHSKIYNGVISLTPEETENGNLKWNCESDLPQEYLPSSCKHMNLAMRAENDPTTIAVVHHDDGTSSWTAKVNFPLNGQPFPGWCSQNGVYLENWELLDEISEAGRQQATVTCRTTKIGK